MIRIARITLREIRLPLLEPFRISSGVVDTRRILLVELADAEGATAWSECVAFDEPFYGPDTIDTCWLAIAKWVAPRVLGHPFAHPRDVFPALERDFRGHLMAKAAVEMGAWVLAAEREGTPLARLLGGTRADGTPGLLDGPLPDAPVVHVAVPRDLEALSPEQRARWRAVTREALLGYLDRGYEVVGFQRGGAGELPYYELAPTT